MKYATIALALVAAVLAQDTPSTGVPACSENCINLATVGNKIAGCTQGDIKCVCSNDSFLSSIACCLADACDEEGQKQAVNFARSICTGAGVSVPAEVVCSPDANSTESQTGTPSATETGTQTGTQTGTETGTETGTDGAKPTETGGSGDDGNGAAGNVASVVGVISGALVVAIALL